MDNKIPTHEAMIGQLERIADRFQRLSKQPDTTLEYVELGQSNFTVKTDRGNSSVVRLGEGSEGFIGISGSTPDGDVVIRASNAGTSVLRLEESVRQEVFIPPDSAGKSVEITRAIAAAALWSLYTGARD